MKTTSTKGPGKPSSLDWKRIVEEYEKSSESQREISDRLGVGIYTFQYWLQKVRQERNAIAPSVGKAESASRFDRYTLQTSGEIEREYEIRLGDSRSLVVRGGVDRDELRMILSVLEEASPC